MKSALNWLVSVLALGSSLACHALGPTVAVIPTVSTGQNFRPSLYGTVAVLVENRSNQFVTDGTIRAVEDEFMSGVIRQGYQLAARSDLQRVQGELRFQNTSGWTEDAVARIGKILGVNGVFVVSINVMQTEDYTPNAILIDTRRRYRHTQAGISARLIDVESAQIEWISTYTGYVDVSQNSQGYEALPLIASVVASGIPKR